MKKMKNIRELIRSNLYQSLSVMFVFLFASILTSTAYISFLGEQDRFISLTKQIALQLKGQVQVGDEIELRRTLNTIIQREDISFISVDSPNLDKIVVGKIENSRELGIANAMLDSHLAYEKYFRLFGESSEQSFTIMASFVNKVRSRIWLNSILIALLITLSFLVFWILQSKKIVSNIGRPLENLSNYIGNYDQTIGPFSGGIDQLYESKNILNQFHKMQLRLEQKLANEGRGQLAAEVSHDLESLISTLKNSTSFAGKDGSESNSLILQHAINRIDQLTKRLLRYNEKDQVAEISLAEVAVSPLVEKVISLKRAEYKGTEQLELKFETPADDLLILADDLELETIMSNLVNNAVEAGEKPNLTICISIKRTNGLCTITVSDNGPGIDESSITRIFENGFSTKGKNRGRGLFQAKEKINTMGGQISVESTLGEGTQFIITFPIVDPSKIIDFKNVQACLIDDYDLQRLSWGMRAKEKGFNLLTFQCYREFDLIKNELGPETAIFIDSRLGDGQRGEDLAKDLSESGFQSIFLTTSISESEFDEMPWIKKVIGKAFPEEILSSGFSRF